MADFLISQNNTLSALNVLRTVWSDPKALSFNHMLPEEVSHQPGDLVAVGFQGEVAGVEQVKFQRLQVALVGLGPGGREDLVVLPPSDQHRRLVFAEVLLPLRIQRRVAAIAQEQVELDLVVSLAVEQELVLGRPVRADEFRVLRPRPCTATWWLRR